MLSLAPRSLKILSRQIHAGATKTEHANGVVLRGLTAAELDRLADHIDRHRILSKRPQVEEVDRNTEGQIGGGGQLETPASFVVKYAPELATGHAVANLAAALLAQAFAEYTTDTPQHHQVTGLMVCAYVMAGVGLTEMVGIYLEDKRLILAETLAKLLAVIFLLALLSHAASDEHRDTSYAAADSPGENYTYAGVKTYFEAVEPTLCVGQPPDCGSVIHGKIRRIIIFISSLVVASATSSLLLFFRALMDNEKLSPSIPVAKLSRNVDLGDIDLLNEAVDVDERENLGDMNISASDDAESIVGGDDAEALQ